MEPSILIRPYNREHREAVIRIWNLVFRYETAHNEPSLILEKKEAFSDSLFFVAETDDREVIGTVMAGYDGHRGWIYSLAVSPAHQRKGIGSKLMEHAEKALTDLGCMKINLQIMEGNEGVESFYRTLGYSTEKRISMGKRIPENIP